MFLVWWHRTFTTPFILSHPDSWVSWSTLDRPAFVLFDLSTRKKQTFSAFKALSCTAPNYVLLITPRIFTIFPFDEPKIYPQRNITQIIGPISPSYFQQWWRKGWRYEKNHNECNPICPIKMKRFPHIVPQNIYINSGALCKGCRVVLVCSLCIGTTYRTE